MAFKRLTGLWLNEGKSGKYMSGKTREEVTIPAGAKLFVFKNDKKKDERDCDYTLNVAEDEGEQQSAGF